MPDPVEYPITNRLRETAVSERPQERLERHGAAALSDTELLAMLLRSGTRGVDVLTLSSRLIAEAGSLAGLLSWKEIEFKKVKGVGPVKALQLMAVMEIARRVIGQRPEDAEQLARPEHVAAFFQPVIAGLQVEKFWLLCLNRKNRLLKKIELSSGTATNTLAHPREVFRNAIREGASAIVCVHNHPSGDPAPSASDMQVTRQLREAAKLVEIHLLDHIILGQVPADPTGRGYYSFRAGGFL